MKNEEIIKQLQKLGEDLQVLAKALENKEMLFDEGLWLEPEAPKQIDVQPSNTTQKQSMPSAQPKTTPPKTETSQTRPTPAAPKQAAFPNLGGFNKLPSMPPLPGMGGLGGIGGIGGMGGLGGLSGIGGMGGLGGLSGMGGMGNIKSLQDIQNNPEMMKVLQNLQNNPDSLNTVASMSGLDINTVKNALSSLTPPNPEASATMAAATEATANTTPAAPVNSVLNNVLNGGQGPSSIFNQLLSGSGSGMPQNSGSGSLGKSPFSGVSSPMQGGYASPGALGELLTRWNWRPS